MYFQGSGVEVPLWVPPAVAFAVSFFTSMVGVSGAFLLLPFQMSVLGIVAPSVSATNLVFNLVATPGGLWRFAKEGRVDWRLGLLMAIGTLPGLLVGWWLRSHWLLNPQVFRLFVGIVLLGLALRMLMVRASRSPASSLPSAPGEWAIFSVSVVVGVIGGAYGIGGGAIMAPMLVAVFGLSVHAVAGATLLATLVTSLAGVAAYSLLPAPLGVDMRPDWPLGLLFGVGGLAGMYAGARVQKFVPQRPLELGLALVVATMAATYITQYFLAGR